MEIVELAINLIPTKPDQSAQSESIQPEPHYDQRCEILFKLAKKIFNTKEEVITFYFTREKNLSDPKLVDLALKNMAVPPDYLTLSKDKRRIHADIHRLIDKILPIAAGSSSLNAQQKLIENR